MIPHAARVRQVTGRILKRLFLTLAFTGADVQDVMIIPTAAAIMIPKVAQPKYLSNGGFTRFPITLWLLVRRTTSRIRGGASRADCRGRDATFGGATAFCEQAACEQTAE
jgi:hypothetical protein